MIKIDNSRNPRYDEYDTYLTNHINGVIRSWKEILRPFLEELIDKGLNTIDSNYLDNIENQIKNHDKSKYESDEYDAYLNHFYPTDEFPNNDNLFNYAWLHHQHVNPHHWQHYCLVRDEDSNDIVKLKIPFNYICEMLCDWSSFKYSDNGTTAKEWYNDNKDHILLNSETREIVECIFNLCEGL